MKTCSKCGETKPLEEFCRDRSKPDGHRPDCRACQRRQNREGYARDQWGRTAESRRREHLRRTFGITPEDYGVMLARQDGLCAVCRRPETDSAQGRFHVDHDHETGALRALLCDRCNRGIGYLQDSPALLRAAADYLERNGDNGD